MATSSAPRRYLDNAATSWPKPEQVLEAWNQAARNVGAAAGRGGHRAAVEADLIRSRARSAAARLLGAAADRVALPGGATLALNMAIHGTVRAGDHLICTAADHNATLRPLHWLVRRGLVELSVVPCDAAGRVDPDAVAAAWRVSTRLVVCSHASNVTGVSQDVLAIGSIVHERGGLLLLDAAQSLGLMPPALEAADILVAPAHKWLQGMAGIAILWAREGLAIEPTIQGGTGSISESVEMPTSFADSLEAGTPDLPALAALAAGLAWREAGGERRLAESGFLAAECAAQLRAISGVRVFGPSEPAAPIVSFSVEGYDPAEVAMLLEQIGGVQARSGFHCAALIHEHLGSAAGGTVRVSFGPCNTADDVEAVVGAVAAIVG